MDGTSLDSELLIVLTWVEVFRRLDPNRPLSLSLLQSFSGPPLLDSCRKCFPDLDPEVVKRLYIELGDPLYERYATLFPYEKEALTELRGKGCRLAIHTNKAREQALKALAQFGLEGLFDAVVAGGDAEQKPSPEGIESILASTGINRENAVYLGDSRFDQLAAGNAGVKFIAASFYPRELLDTPRPVAFLRSYRDLSSILSSCWNLMPSSSGPGRPA